MAAGNHFIFDGAFSAEAGGTHNFSAGTYKAALINSLPVVSQATPTLSDFTQVTASGSYTDGGNSLTVAISRSGGTTTIGASTSTTWASAASGTQSAVAALIYRTSNSAAFSFVDLTDDGGTTPASLQTGPITLRFNNGIYIKKQLLPQ